MIAINVELPKVQDNGKGDDDKGDADYKDEFDDAHDLEEDVAHDDNMDAYKKIKNSKSIEKASNQEQPSCKNTLSTKVR
jgi:hypothetical protein